MIEVDRNSERKMKGVLDRLVKETNRSVVQAMTYQSMMMCRSASSIAQPSPRKRPMFSNPLWNAESGHRWLRYNWKRYQKVPAGLMDKMKEMTPYVIEAKKQPTWESKYIPVWKREDARVNIRRSGLARKSFTVAGALLSSMRTEGSMKLQHRLAEVARVVTKNNVFIRVRSLLSYIGKAFAGIDRVAYERSLSATRLMLDNMIAKKIRSAK